jgi:polyhydroxybutyrate depolymerase
LFKNPAVCGVFLSSERPLLTQSGLRSIPGTGSTPEQQSRISEFEFLAAKSGFFVATPEAKYPRNSDGRLTWNVDLMQHGLDDVRFAEEMIIDISNRFTVDPWRIYATGISGGDRMSSRLACDLAEVIAAIGCEYQSDVSASTTVSRISYRDAGDQCTYIEKVSTYWFITTVSHAFILPISDGVRFSGSSMDLTRIFTMSVSYSEYAICCQPTNIVHTESASAKSFGESRHQECFYLVVLNQMKTCL